MPKGVAWRQHDIFMAAMGGRQIGTWAEFAGLDEITAAAQASAGMRMMPTPPFMHGASQWAGDDARPGGHHARRRLRLSAPQVRQREIHPALEQAGGVGLGLAVPDEDDHRRPGGGALA